MMDAMRNERLRTLLAACCTPVRKGEVVSEKDMGNVRVIAIHAFPSADEAATSATEPFVTVDLHFMQVNVDTKLAASVKDELRDLLKDGYSSLDRLKQGPSYIEVGGELGDQGVALMLFALGQVCGLWTVITPKLLGITGDAADQMAGLGMIMISGFDDGEDDAEKVSEA